MNFFSVFFKRQWCSLQFLFTGDAKLKILVKILQLILFSYAYIAPIFHWSALDRIYSKFGMTMKFYSTLVSDCGLKDYTLKDKSVLGFGFIRRFVDSNRRL